MEDARGAAVQPAEVAPPAANPAFPLRATLGNGAVRLLGYDLDDARAVPGGQVTVGASRINGNVSLPGA